MVLGSFLELSPTLTNYYRRIGKPRGFLVTRFAAINFLRFFVGRSVWSLGLVRHLEITSPWLQRPPLVQDGGPRLCSGMQSPGLVCYGKHFALAPRFRQVNYLDLNG